MLFIIEEMVGTPAGTALFSYDSVDHTKTPIEFSTPIRGHQPRQKVTRIWGKVDPCIGRCQGVDEISLPTGVHPGIRCIIRQQIWIMSAASQRSANDATSVLVFDSGLEVSFPGSAPLGKKSSITIARVHRPGNSLSAHNAVFEGIALTKNIFPWRLHDRMGGLFDRAGQEEFEYLLPVLSDLDIIQTLYGCTTIIIIVAITHPVNRICAGEFRAVTCQLCLEVSATRRSIRLGAFAYS